MDSHQFIASLTEEERETIEKIARHFRKAPAPLTKSEDKFTNLDGVRLRKIVHSYTQFQNEEVGDVVDGYDVEDSSQDITCSRVSVNSSTFISPSRFLVEISDETRTIISSIEVMIQQWKNASLSKAAYKSLNQEHSNEEKYDREKELWEERGKVQWWTILFSFVAPLTYILDVATDLNLARAHFDRGDPSWGALTLVFIILPSIFTNVMSYFFYVNDADKVNRRPQSGWKVVKLTHIFQFGLVER